ncbi:MAG: nucleotide sugar dehydrogenase, partial [Candidatus Micrarchaeota archaeon]|nr:nucleotide sugar dehydrogenase [Candidatus Micrarchaeota archaeon]
MKIAVIGAGYVGIVTAACLAGMGNEVVCVDKDAAKVKKINAGGAPIYEEGLGELVKAGVKKGRLKATGEISRAKQAEIIFICVGTPTAGDGSADLSHVNAVADGIAKIMSDASRYFVVVVKSTVPPGTTDELAKRIAEKSGKKENSNFGVCMNPEFLREGSAVKDFMNPDRVVIGSRGKKAGEAVRKLFSAFEAPVVMTDAKTAEMIKYASNTFLAARISLINEIGNICKTM